MADEIDKKELTDCLTEQARNVAAYSGNIPGYSKAYKAAAVIALGAVVLGAYAFLQNAQKASAETYNSGWYHWSPADFNMDFSVDVLDLAQYHEDWLSPGTISDENYAGTDINKDGIVNMDDFVKLAEEWGRTYTGNAKMKAYGVQITSEPVDEDHPYVGMLVILHNISPLDTDYDMKEVKFNTGYNNGVWTDAENEVGFNNDLSWEDQVDPNSCRAWKVNGANYLGSGEEGTFNVVVVGEPTDDPNDLTFKKDYLNAKTRDATNLDFTPLIVDLPINLNP